MSWIQPFLQYDFLQLALVVSVVVGVTCGVIGSFIILRGMALAGDALSHAVFPGVVAAFALGGAALHFLFAGAMVAGLMCMLLIAFIQRSSRLKGDAATGVIFTAFFALGILMVSQMKKVHIDLNGFLFGNVLGVSSSDMWFIVIVGPLSLLLLFMFYKEFVVSSFDPTLAESIGVGSRFTHYLLMFLLTTTVVTSLQAVGLILVVSMLITPGATAYLLTRRLPSMLALAALFGATSAVLGLFISYHANVASGAAMVLTSFVFFTFALVFAPEDGLLTRALRRWRRASVIMEEDFVKAALAIEAGTPPLSGDKLAHRLEMTPRGARKWLHRLMGKG